MSFVELNIIIPCYNPSAGWEKTVVANYLSLKKSLCEVSLGLVLVNDGSFSNVVPDHISFIEKNIAEFTYIEYAENKGKGFALRKGVEASFSKYHIFTDIDFPYELESILSIFNTLVSGTDVALGSRNEAYYRKTPFFRKIISKLFRWLMSKLLKLHVTDTQCGLKGFNQKGKDEFLKTTINRFLFDLEFIKRCGETKSLVIEEVPVVLKPNVVFSQVKLKILLTELFNFISILLKK